MYYFTGDHALTAFRRQQRLSVLQARYPAIKSLQVCHVYFVDTSSELSDAQLNQLSTLLNQSQVATLPEATDVNTFYVVPRLGTISPWSSKATDIAHHCELQGVKRIEHGLQYVLTGVGVDENDVMMTELQALCHDPLIESVISYPPELEQLFLHGAPRQGEVIPVLEKEKSALDSVNQRLGLSLSQGEIDYLYDLYRAFERDPTDVELMMFAQVNSEHCRHKIFNASWWIDGKEESDSLFDMIRATYKASPHQALVAYSDNAAVLKNHRADRLYIDPLNFHYSTIHENIELVLKVETHNHPTAISPFPGAATGSGGEIRDEAATGRGAFSKAGLCGFSVSHLKIPGFDQPWEINLGKPKNMASPLDIMTAGPVGAASFNNEFGRPNICGYFRSFEMVADGYMGKQAVGYHKPIMIAGGIGNIRESLVHKESLLAGVKLVVLGGPGMAIGLGGGSASSRSSHEQHQQLDFASVQRANPEMQRRCQEVINTCREMNEHNPILSVHDVGAGGLSNALPELVETSGLGATFELRKILIDEPDMTPLEIWCNESQERFVLAIEADKVDALLQICERERCPVAVVGEATDTTTLVVDDAQFDNNPIDLPMSALFEKMPRLVCESEHAESQFKPFDLTKVTLSDAIKRVLQFPCVANKSFLITIGDRSVGGLVSRDQMVGPWQVPVADVAVTATGFDTVKGEAMAMGERPPVALLHPAASARIAVGEAITNISAAPIKHLSDIALSANWMAAASDIGQGAALYDAVEAIGKGFCAELGISIPVGKDSLSMKASWVEGGQEKTVMSPLSLVITAAAPVTDIRRVLTPLCGTSEPSRLLLIDLGDGCNALGGSVLAQTYGELGNDTPDIDSLLLKQFFDLIQLLNEAGLIRAYHDRSDGGLLVTICEMMFASHCGITLNLSSLQGDTLRVLFTEELGAVIQVAASDLATVMEHCELMGLADNIYHIGEVNSDDSLYITRGSDTLFKSSRVTLEQYWSATSYQMQRLRDDPACADDAFQTISDGAHAISAKLTFDPTDNVIQSSLTRPKVAILREQGVNGHMEMAAAFMRAGFDPVDVHMSDLIAGHQSLDRFVGLAACGGFSYGDVLGAGRGWAQTILMHPELRDQFQQFFERDSTFTLGICNGCQMLAQLKTLIPGASAWPRFIRNTSEQFEARLSMVRVETSSSLFFDGMQGSVIPVVVSHGEGKVDFSYAKELARLQTDKQIALRYVDANHDVTERYPMNPNGSHQGITGLTAAAGRVLIMMPHPERVFRTVQHSWHPGEWGEDGPWLRLFRNAKLFL